MSTMLYKAPGPHEIHGGHFDYTIVEDDQIDAALADGWHKTTPEAQAAYEAAKDEEAAQHEAQAEQAAAAVLSDPSKPLTRDQLEDFATRLGIPFSHRVSDKKLKALIEAASQPDTAESSATAQSEPAADAQQGA